MRGATLVCSEDSILSLSRQSPVGSISSYSDGVDRRVAVYSLRPLLTSPMICLDVDPDAKWAMESSAGISQWGDPRCRNQY